MNLSKFSMRNSFKFICYRMLLKLRFKSIYDRINRYKMYMERCPSGRRSTPGKRV